MDQQEKPKRKYHSRRRQEQAQTTRRHILEAAYKQFSENGYAGATIEMIAQEADVAPMTVYAVFGNKRSLLAGLVETSVGGDDQPISLLQRSGPQSVFREKEPINQINLFAVDITNILERIAPIFDIMRTAAKTEPEIADMLKNLLEERLQNLGRFVQHVAANGRLREGMDQSLAAEVVWAVASPELYRLFTEDRGWSKERFSQWLGDTLSRLLLE
ncbi:MAG: TetR/AcrR family transcriptional regulator [Candidatus Promineifilaceae bacterium]